MQMSPPAVSVWREDAPRIVNFRNPSCEVAFTLSSFYTLFTITFVYTLYCYFSRDRQKYIRFEQYWI